MNIYEILAERFTEGTEKYNTIYAAILAGIADGTISERDVLKSPDSVINNLIRTIYSIKGDVVTGMVLVNGVTYEGDGKRYAELDSGSSGGGSGTDTTALIELLNNSINTTTNALSGQIEGLRTETNNTFKDTINLSDMPSYHILKGDISFSNETIVTGYEPLTWAGQATSKTIPITVDMVSQHGDTTNETYGGMILTRAVNITASSWITDSVRKFRSYISTTSTTPGTPNDGLFTSITSTALTLPSLPNLNNTGENQLMYLLGTTHRKSATDGSVELSVNGDFSNGTTGWINNGLLTMSVTNGRMVCTDNSTTGGWFYQDVPTTIGKLYTVKAELISATGGDVNIGVGTTSDVWSGDSVSITNGFGATTFKATATTTRVAIQKATAVTAFTIDNISIKENTNPTNHNRWWECHYNPTTGLAIINFEGSGLPKHEIRHFLGRELDFTFIKSNTHVGGWRTQFRGSSANGYEFMYLNTDAASVIPSGNSDSRWKYTSDALLLDRYDEVNNNKYMYSMYGFANSYKDDAGKTIGAFEIGEYVPGQDNYRTEINLRGDPALIIIKRLDVTAMPWLVVDGITRGKFSKAFKLNSNAVDQAVAIAAGTNKFYITGTDPIYRAYGGRYAYMVIYNTEGTLDSKYKFKKPTSTANLLANNIVAPIGSGVADRGGLITTVSKNDVLSGITYTLGENFLFINKLKTITTSKIAPKFLFNIDTTVNKGGFERDYEYDIVKQKWIKVINSDINENIKKDTLDFFGDGSCKALYKVNGDLVDVSGNYNPVNTNIGFGEGKFGQSAIISANNSIMGLASTPLPIAGRVITISNWIKDTIPNYNMGFGRRNSSSSYGGYQWFRILGGLFSCGLSQNADYALYNFTIGRTGWNHYVTVLDGAYIIIYVNGIKEFEYIMSPDVITIMNNFSVMYGIMEESAGYAGSNDSIIQIDQIRIFNRAITSEEAFNLYACYSYTYTDSNSTFLDHSVIANGDNKILSVKKYPKSQYIDKLIVNELEVVKQHKPVKRKMLNVVNSRIGGKNYYNTTTEDMYVSVYGGTVTSGAGVWLTVDGTFTNGNQHEAQGVNDALEAFIIVPPGSYYSANITVETLLGWWEYKVVKDS